MRPPSSHTTGRTHRIRRFLLTVQLPVSLNQTDKTQRIEPGQVHALHRRRASASTPPAFAAERSDPGAPLGHAQLLEELSDRAGAFALFEPGQQKRLHAHIIEPEGRIYFAGEHASREHAWIDGAIESGLRSAGAIHTLP